MILDSDFHLSDSVMKYIYLFSSLGMYLAPFLTLSPTPLLPQDVIRRIHEVPSAVHLAALKDCLEYCSQSWVSNSAASHRHTI